MKKYYFLIIVALILGLVLTGCSLLSNISQVPATNQSGITYLTKNPSPPGLVGLWHFDGDALDSSGNSNHGTVYGASWVDGKFGQALSFDGVDDYVDCRSVLQLNGVSEFTVEFWIKVDSLPFPTIPWQGIIARGNAHQRTPWVFGNRGKSNLYMQFETTAIATDCDLKTNDLTAGQWHHVAFTWDGHTVTSYLDGVAGPTDTTVGSVLADTDGSLKLGYIPSYAYFNGTIDEVRIWKTALTADQLILYDGFNGLLAPYKEPPKAFKAGSSIPLKWQYTDLFGIAAVDSSAADPSVEIKWASNGNTFVEGDLIVVNDPGSSGYQYDSETDTWQFNWQTKNCVAGDYNIWIINSWTGQTFEPSLIRLR